VFKVIYERAPAFPAVTALSDLAVPELTKKFPIRDDQTKEPPVSVIPKPVVVLARVNVSPTVVLYQSFQVPLTFTYAYIAVRQAPPVFIDKLLALRQVPDTLIFPDIMCKQSRYRHPYHL
jgi:hypothetical protein